MVDQHKISGPVNIVRLEGNVFGVKKVLYVFFDVHMNCTDETRCDDIFSDTVLKYLADNFARSQKQLDFFMEIYPRDLFRKKDNMRSKYILELNKMVAQSFHSDENKALRSKIFPKVRLHYVDIRDYMLDHIIVFYKNTAFNMFYMLYDRIECGKSIPNPDSFNAFNENMNIFTDHINSLISVVNKQYGGKLIYDKNVDESEIFNYFINKIKYKYKHAEVKDVMMIMLNKYFTDGLKVVINKIDMVNQLISNLMKLYIPDNVLNEMEHPLSKYSEVPAFVTNAHNYGSDLNQMVEIMRNIMTTLYSIDDICMRCYATIVDVFFLRRFLDKDYITNGISYTGAGHSEMYVYILTKYFGFNITHASYSKYEIDELNKIVKEMDFNNEFSLIFIPPIQQQCSDISHFPKNFN